MDSATPPIRMTRSRAAARATSSKLTSQKSTASRSESTTTGPTSLAVTTAVKRKQPDEDQDDKTNKEATQPTAKRAATSHVKSRGRPTKATATSAMPTRPVPTASEAMKSRKPIASTTATRVGQKPSTETSRDEPGRATRARAAARKATRVSDTVDEDADDPLAATVNKPARGRSVLTKTGPKPTAGKMVKFADTDKENVIPTLSAKARAALSKTTDSVDGLRAKPIRRTATASAKSKGSSKSSSTGSEATKPTPLSPKKISQLRGRIDIESDDELSMPSRPKSSPFVAGSSKNPAAEGEHAISRRDARQTEDGVISLIRSPARRPPPSPFKDALRSPAKRLGLGSDFAKTNDDLSLAVPVIPSLLLSPARRLPSAETQLAFMFPVTREDTKHSPHKQTLLQSPAKRGARIFGAATPVESINQTAAFDTYPAPITHQDVTKQPKADIVSAGAQTEAVEAAIVEDKMVPFPGRLSAIQARGEDDDVVDQVLLDGIRHDYTRSPRSSSSRKMGESSLTRRQSPTKASSMGQIVQRPTKPRHNAFGLRSKDLDVFRDDCTDTEDEITQPFDLYEIVPPTTPCPTGRQTEVNSTARSSMAITPLIEQLEGWRASSPLKEHPFAKLLHSSPDRPSAFESAIAQVELQESEEFHVDLDMRDDVQIAEPVLPDVEMVAEDIALAAEANEMAQLEPDEMDKWPNSDAAECTASEDSQEYGDENAMPLDPMLTAASASEIRLPPITPKRVFLREFHTTSKVPLKQADDSVPKMRGDSRRHSASRLPLTRTTNRGIKSNSMSPIHAVNVVTDGLVEKPVSRSPVTPEKQTTGDCAALETPNRTPRPDLNPHMLRGAVVHVDAHTSEGADASGLFYELLTQMGARCVKQWTWNSRDSDGEASTKIGITHVVYKDGGKRTLEKVRESGGVVQCVGVGWVLDCERQNEWLDEAAYHIDTSSVPRGGGRRRKSMEPTAIANLNGTLVSESARSARSSTKSRRHQSLPATPPRRRDSSLWVLSPRDDEDAEGEELDDGELDWSLTPVPKTPAPDDIRRFIMNISPGTPTTDEDDDDDIGMLARREELMTRTCPPKQRHRDMGAALVREEYTEAFQKRLLAARRKTLQYAPKNASPLCSSWKLSG